MTNPKQFSKSGSMEMKSVVPSFRLTCGRGKNCTRLSQKTHCLILLLSGSGFEDLNSVQAEHGKNSTRKIQSLEFVMETRILAEMKSKIVDKYSVEYKSTSIFFSMKIKRIDLLMQIESIKLIFVMNFSVLHFLKFAPTMLQIAQILVLTFKIFWGEGGGIPPAPPGNFLLFFH